MKILGIITARGGSKRVPRKNIKNFLGKPLLAWTIETGKGAGVFDRFVLSTEDKEIANIGREHGIEVPFERPSEFASDTASSYEVIKHAVEYLKNNENYNPDWIILLEPSSPGRQVFHVQEVANIIKGEHGFDSLVGISEISPHYSYLKQFEIDSVGIMERVIDHAPMKKITHRNQNVAKSYFINSTIYAFKTTNLFDQNKSLWGESTYGYIMDNKYAIDIDTLEDWMIAELKMSNILRK